MFNKNKKYSSVLFLPDLHMPYHNEDAVEWAASLQATYETDLVVQLGDISDQRSWSRFVKDPDFDNPTLEFSKLVKAGKWLEKLFPSMYILYGNHSIRIIKKAFEVGLPKELVKGLSEIFPYKGWEWGIVEKLIINQDVLAIHGDEMAGTAFQKAKTLGISLVQGHTHKASLSYFNAFDKQIFGAEAGCLVDLTSSAFRYAAKNPTGCWLGVMLLLDGVPVLLPYPGKGNW